MRTFVTGATGAVGRQLIPALQATGHQVVAATRRPDRYQGPAEAVRLDLDAEDVDPDGELRNADIAYYLVHALDQRDYRKIDRRRAERFAEAWGPDRPLVYLGGLGDDAETDTASSKHLRSRHEVGQILRDRCATVEVRAAMVIGTESLSFRLLKRLGHLAGFSLLPVAVPLAARTLTQPVAEADLIVALVAAVEASPGIYHLGGPDVVSFAQLIERSAKAQGQCLRVVPSLPFEAQWLGPAAAAISGVDPWATTALFGSMGVETLADPDRRLPGLPPPSISLDDALAAALLHPGSTT